MSKGLLSILLTAHLAAVLIGGIPLPGNLPDVGPVRAPDRNPVAAVATPIFDRAAAAIETLWRTSWALARPVQGLALSYLGAVGIAPHWRMFSNPPQIDDYLRLRYYVRDAGAPASDVLAAWTATELVMPAHREDRVRLLQSFRDSYRDKALAVAVDNHISRLDLDRDASNMTASDLPDSLVPVAHFFATRFAEQHLILGETVMRTEVWYGLVPNPQPGESLSTGARREALQIYYDGPREDYRAVRQFPIFHTVETEADITWVLEYFEE